MRAMTTTLATIPVTETSIELYETPAAAATTYEPLEPGDYTREVRFVDPIDRAGDESDWPIHVLGSRKMFQLDVELDGDLIPGVLDATVEFGRSEATIVTLWVDPQLCDVAVPAIYDGKGIPGGLHGHALLTPHREHHQVAGWAWDWQRELVICEIYAARVVFE